MSTIIIKSILWIICFLCLYIILTTHDIQTFGVVGFVGFIATWILIRWNKYENKIEETIKKLDV
jgi:ABC-type iron transport system FetAB permease component